MAYGTCAIDGCETTGNLSRTWCRKHYQRWWRGGGDPPPPPKRGKPANTGGCSMAECDRKHYAKGLCNLHWQRNHKYGSPTAVGIGHYKGHAAGYSAVHERLNRNRGHAREFPCAHCGKPAVDWAYDGACPNELLGERHGRLLTYSTDPARYMPLCRKCHSQYDGLNGAQRGARSPLT